MEHAVLILTIVKVVAIFGFVFNMGGAMTFIERKQSALMQNRIGGNRAELPFISERIPVLKHVRTLFGMWHNIADGIKMILKENFHPRVNDKLIYNLAIWFAVVPVFITFAVIPISGPVQPGILLEPLAGLHPIVANVSNYLHNVFGERAFSFSIADLDIGLLFIFAMGGLGVFGAVLAGWSSNNKFSTLGGIRAASQMVSYEISLGLSLMGLILIVGSVKIVDIINYQSYMIGGVFPRWGIFFQPIAFFLFFTSCIAENKRIPFDLPEAESELVSGYFTEYSAMKMGLFMLGEFAEIFVVAALITTLFLGGYHVPWLTADGFEAPFAKLHLPHLAVFLIQHLSFVIKCILLVWIQMLIRWTLPRFRHDQLMRLGWKNMLPIAIINLLVTIAVVIFRGVHS